MSESEDSNNSDQQYTVVDQVSYDQNDDKHRRSRRRESQKSKKTNNDQTEFDSDEEDSNTGAPSSRYEEDEDYQEPSKKKQSKPSKSSSGSEKKKSKKKSKHDSDDESLQPSIADDSGTVDEGQRSVPPLKIKLPPPREKSKRSKRTKEQQDDSMTMDDDDFIDNSIGTSREQRKSSKNSNTAVLAEESASSSANTVPTRRSERIFVSNAKKVDSTPEGGGDTQDETMEEVEDFKIIHKDTCQSCRQSGELILCDYCPRAYHKVCLDEELTELPDDWCCPNCQKNGKPDIKELKQQQAAMVAKKKKKQAMAMNKPLPANAKPTTSAAPTKPREFENRDYCETCNQCGELLLCDTCPRAYHLVCMNETASNIPSGNWSCPYCQEHGVEASNAELEEKTEKAEKIICKSCRQTGGDIVFCATCSTRIHIGCLNPPLEEMPEVWHCLACSVEPLKGKVQRILTWRWKKPAQEPENEKTNMSAEDQTKNLLKNLKNRKPREREFFVKWKDMSYWHCSWIDEGQLQVFHSNMFRFYLQKNDMTNPPMFDEMGMLTTNLAEPKSEELIETEQEGGDTNAKIASRHRRRKRCSNLPPEVEETYVRFGVRPEWLLIHRIVNHRKNRGKIYYLIKWRDLAYEEVTAEPEPENCDFDIPDYQKKIDEYWNLRRLVEEETATGDEDGGGGKHKKRDRDEKRKGKDKKKKGPFGMHPKTDPKKKLETQPEYIPEPLKLHDYQMEGISWLRYSWASNIDTILADEMGLGKTIQTVSFLYSLYKEGHSRGPFLIAAPLSTIINWERELEDWAPDFYVVNYTGNKDSRIIIRENELSFDSDVIRTATKATRIRKQVPVKFHVLLTSYELINVDSALLGSIDWKVLVVDEAHRLKSNQSLFFRTLNQYNVGHKLLLTGTPLQNNLEELFNLLNFLSPERFCDMDGFLNEFADIAKEEQVKKLHELLGPHLLRRLKADVLTGMPAKSEFIIRVDLAPLQKKYYKYILTRNFDALNSKGGGKQVSLLNIVMDLKKCCNHPYLFPVAAEEAPKTKFGYFEGGPLVKASGKLIVMQKMLRKLKDEGHRVLIFSQMTQMLDVLEDFLEAEGYKYERIDGSITGSVRQEAIDRFNAPGAKQFVFLLSTRAGGLGINLATADTVVIYDSDWNPHNDIQALSRAHRIGQTNKVMIYRFVTRNSVEERITQVAKKKMMLTHLVVRPGLGSQKANATMSKQELDDILKFGTEELFKEEETKESETIHYDDKAIEGLLDRTQEGIEQKEMWSNEYLSSFKVANYVTKEADEIEEELEEVASSKQKDESQNDPHYWEKLLGAHYMQFQENLSRSLGKGKRVRKQVNYLDSASGQNDYQNHDTSESSDFSVPSDVSENDEDFDERMEGRNQKSLRNKNPTKEKMPPLLSCVGPNTEVLGFTPKHRKVFLDLVMRFGLPNLDYNLTDSQFFIRELKNKSEKHLRAYTSLFISHLCEPGDPNSQTFEDGVPKEGLNVSQVLTRIGIISLIKRKVHEYESKNGCVSFKLPKKQQPQPPQQIQTETLAAQSTSVGVGTGSSEAEEKPPVASAASGKAPVASENDATSEVKTEDNVEKMEVDGSEEVKKEVKNETEESEMDVDKKEPKEEIEENKDDVQSKAESEEEKKKIEKKADDAEKSVADGSKVKTENGNDDNKEKTEVPKSEEEIKKEQQEQEVDEVRPFEFNIEDGGLTELHTLWYFEEKELKPGHEHEIWNRRHDYWMLTAIVKHGYERWHDISMDEDLAILTEPFKSSANLRDKFMERRLRLLEQALVFEEQLRRYSHLANQELHIVKKPLEEPMVIDNNDGEKKSPMVVDDKKDKPESNGKQDADDETKAAEKKKDDNDEKDEDAKKKKNETNPNDQQKDAAAADAPAKKEETSNKKPNVENGTAAASAGEDKENDKQKANHQQQSSSSETKILNPNIQKACNQLEDLLVDMKSDCARIPQTVQRIPTIANRLQLGPRASITTNTAFGGMALGGQSSNSLLSNNRM